MMTFLFYKEGHHAGIFGKQRSSVVEKNINNCWLSDLLCCLLCFQFHCTIPYVLNFCRYIWIFSDGLRKDARYLLASLFSHRNHKCLIITWKWKAVNNIIIIPHIHVVLASNCYTNWLSNITPQMNKLYYYLLITVQDLCA